MRRPRRNRLMARETAFLKTYSNDHMAGAARRSLRQERNSTRARTSERYASRDMAELCVPEAAVVRSNGVEFDVVASRDQVNQRVEFDEERLGDLLELVRGSVPGKALELGAAPYLLTASLVSAGFEVTANGLPTTEFGPLASLSLRMNGRHAEIPLLFFDAEEPFPVGDGSFDLVVAGEIFEHLVHQPWVMLSESNRVLRPDGRLVLSTPNAHSLEWGYRWMKRDPMGMGFNPEAPTVRHAREYGVAELVAVVESQGFTVDEARVASYSHIVGGFPGALGWAKRRVYRWLKRRSAGNGRLLGGRGDTILLTATKTGQPGDPPEFMRYAVGDPRTGCNFD
jgi:SAM-dependent methyltransferase